MTLGFGSDYKSQPVAIRIFSFFAYDDYRERTREIDENLGNFIKEEVLKLHRKTLLEAKKEKIEKDLKILKEGEINHTQDWEFFPITIPLGSSDIKIFKNVIDKGIDSHLEGFTKSKFSSKDGRLVLNFHNSELPILIRRLKEMYDETGEEEYLTWAEDIDRVSKEESI
jgi:hypothetical protein